MRTIGRISVLALAIGAAACVPRQQPDSAPPAPVPSPTPSPAPAPTPAPPIRAWADLPLTTGNWSFGTDAGITRAIYAAPGGAIQFALECDRGSRRIALVREGAESGGLTLQTSYGARTLPAAARPGPRTALAANLSATDPLLDQIAFSRGRFTVDAPGTARLVLPAWPETARVIEECRL